MLRTIIFTAVLALLTIPTVAQGSIEDLTRQARTGKSYQQARAVRSLAELDQHEAWAVILELLDADSGEAAGSAQWYLGTTTDQSIVAELLGKAGLGSKDEVVRWRAADALGRSPLEIDTAPLWKVAAKDRSADVRRAAWHALGLQSSNGTEVLGSAKESAKRVKLLLKAAAKDKDPEVRGLALIVAARLLAESNAPESLALLRKSATDKRYRVRAAAAVGLGRTDASNEVLRTLAADEHWAVRRTVIEAWAATPTRATMRLLAGRLEGEKRGRLRARLVTLLRGFSGLRHRADVRPWTAWVDTLPEDWKPGKAPKRVEPLEVSSTWKGFPILSDRMAILIDLSGSIREKREDGVTRKEIVDGELKEALESLNEDAQFVLIGYHNEVLAWADELRPATPKNVASALKWFGEVSSSGKGNLWSAIEYVWELSDEIDTILVLHDGAPTGGLLYRAELYRETFLKRSLTRGIFFDTILVDASKWVGDRFTELAERSGGMATNRELIGKK